MLVIQLAVTVLVGVQAVVHRRIQHRLEQLKGLTVEKFLFSTPSDYQGIQAMQSAFRFDRPCNQFSSVINIDAQDNQLLHVPLLNVFGMVYLVMYQPQYYQASMLCLSELTSFAAVQNGRKLVANLVQTLVDVEVPQVEQALNTNREMQDKLGYLMLAYCRDVLLLHKHLHQLAVQAIRALPLLFLTQLIDTLAHWWTGEPSMKLLAEYSNVARMSAHDRAAQCLKALPHVAPSYSWRLLTYVLNEMHSFQKKQHCGTVLQQLSESRMQLEWAYLTMFACKQVDATYIPVAAIQMLPNMHQYYQPYVALLYSFSQLQSQVREVDFLVRWIQLTSDLHAFKLMFDRLQIRQAVCKDLVALTSLNFAELVARIPLIYQQVVLNAMPWLIQNVTRVDIAEIVRLPLLPRYQAMRAMLEHAIQADGSALVPNCKAYNDRLIQIAHCVIAATPSLQLMHEMQHLQQRRSGPNQYENDVLQWYARVLAQYNQQTRNERRKLRGTMAKTIKESK